MPRSSPGPPPRAAELQDLPTAAEPLRLKVGSDGRVLIPAALRASLRLGDAGVVSAWIENGELRMVAPAVAIERIQSSLRSGAPEAGSVVDQFLAERRKRWGET